MMLLRCRSWIGSLLLRRATASLAALLADAAIELGALLSLRGFPTLLADLGIKGRTKLLFYSFSALLADAAIEFGAILLSDGLATMLGFLRAWFWSAFACCHVVIHLSVMGFRFSR